MAIPKPPPRAVPILVSLVLLLPCFWQVRIQAGDLSSHIYNSWLAVLVEQGQAPGLELRWVWTNTLFDLILTWLLKLAGAGLAQRLAVSLCVLVFYWGALQLAYAVHGSRSWAARVFLAMFAYGYVFHAGFFNFYLSLGLSLWALALSWNPTRNKVLLAALLTVLAVLAHALPAGMAAGLGLFVQVTRRLSAMGRMALLAAAIVAMVVARLLIPGIYVPLDQESPLRLVAAADQLVVFGLHYLAVSAGMIFFWVLMTARLAEQKRIRQVAAEVPFQVCVLTGLAVLIAPARVDFPYFSHGLVYIPDRMSLLLSVLICVWLGTVELRRMEKTGALALAAVFFGFLYWDTARFNRLEDAVESAVAGIPSRQRIVSAIDPLPFRLDPVVHMVHRACVGKCYSFGNYEPSTGQFRLIARGKNSIVAHKYADSWAIQSGEYRARADDLPMYVLHRCTPGADRICARELQAGERVGAAAPR